MRKPNLRIPVLVFVVLASALLFVTAKGLMGPRGYARAAESCGDSPTSQCLGSLALMRLPDYGSIDASSDMSLSFRHLGYHDVADERMKGNSVSLGADVSIRFYELLRNDATAFSREPLDERPHVYGQIWDWLDDDYPHRRPVLREVRTAELAARDRRMTNEPTSARRTLYARWRESVEQHGTWFSHWSRFAEASLALGHADAAKHALVRARPLARATYEQSALMRLTFALAGAPAALDEALALGNPYERNNALVRLSREAVEIGDADSARQFLEQFEHEYSAYAPGAPPGGPDLPSTLDKSGDRWLITASELWNKLGNQAEAERWASIYADSFEKPQSYAAAKAYARIGEYSRAIETARTMLERIEPEKPYDELSTWNQLRAAQPYVEVADVLRDAGALEEALEAAKLGLQQAPAPGRWLFGVMNSTKSTGYYNTAASAVIGLLCETHRFDAAFSMAQSNEDAAFGARIRCRNALEEQDPNLSIAKFGKRMGLYSNRFNEVEAAASLVEKGQYADAASTIQQSLDSRPYTRESSPASANLNYLRLAVAMRDEPLTREVAGQVIADTRRSGDIDAVNALQEAAIIMLTWPEDDVP